MSRTQKYSGPALGARPQKPSLPSSEEKRPSVMTGGVPHVQPLPSSSEEMRRAVMTSAVDVVADGGMERLNLREVVRRCGVPHSASARLFRNREGLVSAVAEEGFLALFATIDGAVSTVPAQDSHARLQAAAVAWTSFASNNAPQYRMMMASSPLSRTGSAGLLRSALLVFGRLVRFIEQGQASGKIRHWPAQDQALVMWASLHGLSLLLIDGQLEALGLTAIDSQRLGSIVADRVLQGLST